MHQNWSVHSRKKTNYEGFNDQITDSQISANYGGGDYGNDNNVDNDEHDAVDDDDADDDDDDDADVFQDSLKLTRG